jgi:hypothetical protein
MRVVASIAAPAFVGQKVKVKAPITVFHVPKTKGAATQLQGLTGTVAALADVQCAPHSLSRASAPHPPRQHRRNAVVLHHAAQGEAPSAAAPPCADAA